MASPKKRPRQGHPNDPAALPPRNSSNGHDTTSGADDAHCLFRVQKEEEYRRRRSIASAIEPGSANLLAALLGPVLSTTDFLNSHFQQRAVHIEGSVERFRSLIDDSLYSLSPSAIYEHTASTDGVFVWIRPCQDHALKITDQANRKSTTDDISSTSGLRSLTVDDVDTVMALHDAGHATYCRAPPEAEEWLVRSLLRDTGVGCGQYGNDSNISLGRGEVEVFVTSRPGGRTGWHTDFQENFTLQLSGVKEWELQPAHVKHPLRACTPHFGTPDQNLVESQYKAVRLASDSASWKRPSNVTTTRVRLTPGDVLYHPAGIWHAVSTIQPGVSINISLMATNYATLASQAIQHILQREDRFRQVVRRTHATERLADLLKDLPALLQKRQLTAECILPPFLRNDNLSANNNTDEIGDDNSSKSSSSSSTSTSSIVNADQFSELKHELECDSQQLLTVNPLATVFKKEDIDLVNQQKAASDSYVLHVSFGGNEDLESYVRRDFLTSRWSELCEWLQGSNQNKEIPHTLRSLVNFLYHYGYLVRAREATVSP